MSEFEAEIYRGIFDARAAEIEKVLELFFVEHANFGSTIETKIEFQWNRQTWFGEFFDENKILTNRIYGYIEINPHRRIEDKPVEVRIVCCSEFLVIFWEEMAHQLRLNYWMGYLDQDSLYLPSFSLSIDSILKTDYQYAVEDEPRESDHYAYPYEKRKAIVEHYREELKKGLIQNKQAWASIHYHISDRTLLNYEKEFPDEK